MRLDLASMEPSSHRDSFTRDRLPPVAGWPQFNLGEPPFDYGPRLNCVSRLLDSHVAEGRGDRPCLLSMTTTWTYADLLDRVNRIANVLVRHYGFVPGNRVLLRSANNPTMVAVYLAVLKAGGVVVATMPLLRGKELAPCIDKAEISLALCDVRLLDEMEKARALAPRLTKIVTFNGAPEEGLEGLMAGASAQFEAVDTASDDVCLLGFTSGTTGVPKATMHFHRDVMAIADSYGRQVLGAQPDDRFIGSPPLAFTFGLGGLVVFPLAVGASTVLLERTTPEDLLEGVSRLRATVLFTAPTAYRAMLAALPKYDTSSLRRCVSAGETLPKPTFDAWLKATGLKLMDGIGSTEMLHIFIAAKHDEIVPGATGKPIPGFEAKIVDGDGVEVARGTSGFLAVRGPTGCRYLDDVRQGVYVRNGWNLTGDTFVQDADGYFWYQARSDDMIVSAGYNISGPEVETALLTHAAVAECGVVGAPDADRGLIVKAYVVLAPGVTPSPELSRALQDHVKAEIAPYKYPRAIEFCEALPKTPSGKLQRAALRQMAQEPARRMA